MKSAPSGHRWNIHSSKRWLVWGDNQIGIFYDSAKVLKMVQDLGQWGALYLSHPKNQRKIYTRGQKAQIEYTQTQKGIPRKIKTAFLLHAGDL